MAAEIKMNNFKKNVFINCPFDNDYTSLLRPLLFTIVYFGYNPRIALERFDSAESRLNKICDLISESKFSIHDLSRMKAKKKNEFYRMNMPFELGVDFGCKRYGSSMYRTKLCLVLDQESHRYRAALSDLSGSDIKRHKNNPEDLVRAIRNWFVAAGHKSAASGTAVWEAFNEFMADFYEKRKAEGFHTKDLQIMPIPELISFMEKWAEARSSNTASSRRQLTRSVNNFLPNPKG